MMELFTTIVRDGLVRDVSIEFGEGATFEGAELDCPEDDDHVLTEAEMQVLREWFATNHDKALEALQARFERAAANDNRRELER